MSKNRTGNFITGNPVALTQTSNAGVWDLKDQYHATTNNTWQETDGIYEIGRSLRFKQSASAYLERTPSRSGNRKTWTYSTWVKFGAITNGNTFNFGLSPQYGGDNANECQMYLMGTSDGNAIRVYDAGGSSGHFVVRTTSFHRDPSAWYHIVVAVDTTLESAGDRVKIFVNGVRQLLSIEVLVSQNQNTGWNHTFRHRIGVPGYTTNDSQAHDGQLAEINHIDGQALDPSYFGYFDSITNIWQPKKYTSQYGINGFYLPFSENQTLRNLGRNFAGGTNICPFSESVASWGTNNNCTVTSNSTTAPNGTLTADTITASSTASAFMRQDTGINVGISTDYTMSCYIKAGTATTATLSDGYGTGTFVYVDLTNGTIISTGNNSFGYQEVSVHSVGNGWYRVRNSFRTNTIDYNIGLRVDVGRSYGDNGASGASVFVWGAQINLGRTMDPYHSNDVSTRVDNNWTPNNISITAGATYDSMVDSPTNIFTTANDTGGVVSGNYATLNPIYASNGSSYSNANLQGTTNGSSAVQELRSTFEIPTSGKWYCEMQLTEFCTSPGGTARATYGVHTSAAGQSSGLSFRTESAASGSLTSAVIAKDGVSQGSVTVPSTNDILGFAINSDASSVQIFRQGASIYSGSYSFISGNLFVGVSGDSSGEGGSPRSTTTIFNFGQRPFAYTPPTGFKSLNTTNIQALGTSATGNAAITPYKWFDTTIYGGTNTGRNVVNSGFQPDLIWIKSRNSADYHNLVDSVRGVDLNLFTNTTDNETIFAGFGVSSFNSDGFGLINNGSYTNAITNSYVAWQWKAGGAAVTNTAGTISARVSASTTSGFSVVTYTGTGSTATIGHGLGVAPSMIIYKRRTGGADSWIVYHASLGAAASITLNNSNAANGSGGTYYWNGTAPTSSVFSVATDSALNAGATPYVAYGFAEVPGFSKFGSYTGNSSANGPFVHCGFRPKWIFIRSTSGLREWNCWDTARGPYNLFNGGQLNLGDSHSEYTGAGYNDVVDFLSNGFKLRSAVSPNYNHGETYIFGAFAESPFALNNRAR